MKVFCSAERNLAVFPQQKQRMFEGNVKGFKGQQSNKYAGFRKNKVLSHWSIVRSSIATIRVQIPENGFPDYKVFSGNGSARLVGDIISRRK